MQWGLAAGSLLLAGFSCYWPDIIDLYSASIALVILGGALVVFTGVETLRTREAGKSLMIASVFVSYWMEVLGLALKDFPGTDPVPWSHWPDDLVRQGLWFVAIFQFCILIGYALRPGMKRARRWAASRIDRQSLSCQYLLYGMAVLSVVPFVVVFGGDVRRAASALLAARSDDTVFRDPTIASYLAMFGIFATVVLLLRAFRRGSRMTDKFIALLAVIPFALAGTRHVWMFATLPVLVVTMRRMKGVLSPSRAIRWVLIAVALLVVSQLQTAMRSGGWTQVTPEAESEFKRLDAYGNFTPQLFAQFLVPRFHNYFMEPATPFFFTHFILRRFWPNKPDMAFWEYYDYAWVRGGVGNVTPSITGQYYMNWGVAGVILIGIWMGLLARIADSLLGAIDVDRQTAMGSLIGLFYAFLVAAFRFYAPFYFAYVVFAWAGMLILTSRVRRNSLVSNHNPVLRTRS